MTVGMSAPPIGTISITPKTSAKAMKTGNSQVVSGRTASTAPQAIATPSSDRFTTFWLR